MAALSCMLHRPVKPMWLQRVEASEREGRQHRLRNFHDQPEPGTQQMMENRVMVHLRSKLQAIDVDHGQMLKDAGTDHTFLMRRWCAPA